MGKLFGTDGIRGKANQHPITPEIAVNVGRAVACFFQEQGARKRIIIGKDTRISGDMIEAALIAGICSMGIDVKLVGVLPTPGIAYMTSTDKACAGIVISASHNPYTDNGIKIFKTDGYKLTDDLEDQLESYIFDGQLASKCASIPKTGKVFRADDAVRFYSDFLTNTFPNWETLSGIHLVIDCSNGATATVAPALFERLGAKVTTLFGEPDGININADCGSEHPMHMARCVREEKATLGLAFDGDGDRLIACDENGHVLTGDQVLAICTQYAKAQGTLKNNILVTTIMSNLGLSEALSQMRVTHVKADVGDRYVMAEMLANGAVLGGENSGHMIFHDHHTTGDGLIAALKLLSIIRDRNTPLSELAKVMTVFPQVMVNVEVKDKPDINTLPEVQAVIASVESELGARGRVLVRYSGTQPMCRVMVEGPSTETTETYCRKIVAVVKKTIGA